MGGYSTAILHVVTHCGWNKIIKINLLINLQLFRWENKNCNKLIFIINLLILFSHYVDFRVITMISIGYLEYLSNNIFKNNKDKVQKIVNTHGSLWITTNIKDRTTKMPELEVRRKVFQKLRKKKLSFAEDAIEKVIQEKIVMPV